MITLFRNVRNASRPFGKLAILVPTYRFDARARHTIAATASLASDNIAVLVADNSENPDKWDYLRKLKKLHANIHIFCHSRNIGAFANWRLLFENATLDYYLFVGDDDYCTPPYVESGLGLLEQHRDASAAAGQFIMVTTANQTTMANRARIEAAPYQRCVNFVIGGGNSLPNSMARRDAVQPYLDYVDGHPLKASFFDWMMSYTLLASGKYYTEDQGLYLYDVSNWENAQATWASNAKFYVAAGLPEAFTWFHELYWAVEFAHFFRGAFTPIADRQQSLDSAQFFYLNRIGEFRRIWQNPGLARPIEEMISHRHAAVDALHSLVANDDAMHPHLFDWFSEVLASFDPVCAAAYADYVSASLDRATVESAPPAGR